MAGRKDLVDICQRVFEKGFVSAYNGNISMVTSEKIKVLIGLSKQNYRLDIDERNIF